MFKRFKLVLATICLIFIAGVYFRPAEAYPADRPSILFCSPQGAVFGWVDLNYLSELHKKGFEVNYTDDLSNISIEELSKHNVLVIFVTIERPKDHSMLVFVPPLDKEFAELIEKYLEMGGSVFVMTPELNVGRQLLADLMPKWGIRIPLERIRERDPEKIAPMSQMGYYVPAAFTNNILPSPVSKGVNQIWYPYLDFFNGQMTLPLWVDKNWQVVVRASATSVTEPVDLTAPGWKWHWVEDPFSRPEGIIKAPPIFAIRDYKAGRIAFMSQFPQFSIGSGTRWLYNREILSRGLKGKHSDFGQLLENTFRWLAEPSLRKGFPGGRKTDQARLLPINRRPDASRGFEEIHWRHERDILGFGRPPRDARIFRGVIGVKTTYSIGRNTVREYAEAARALGIDFLVFLDDFDKLTEEEFNKLKAETIKYSDERVQLFAGYTIENNIGNNMFIFGPRVELPPKEALTGPGRTLLNQQYQDRYGNWDYNAVVLHWLLRITHHDMLTSANIGFYNFTDSRKKGGMDIPDLRMYGMAALRYYADGRLIEDMTDDYLTTAQGTLPPSPVSFNLVTSVAELEQVIENNQALTYVLATSLEALYREGLRYTHQYDGINIFVSNGPRILAWPFGRSVVTWGGEEFVTGRMLMPSHISVSSEIGLREIRIYNGQNLFRRFILNGEKEYNKTLMLEGVVQKTLILIAEDVDGNRAVSFARRSWADGAMPVMFCADRVNDCKSPWDNSPMLLARGSNISPVTFTPLIPDAGYTWDGGPGAALPLVMFRANDPLLDSNRGIEDGFRFNQIPLLEFTSETAAAISSVKTEVFKDGLPIHNAWHTYGPKEPSRLFNYTHRYRIWHTPTIGTYGTKWAGWGLRVGIRPSLFRGEITFKEDLRINSLRLLGNAYPPIRVDEAYLYISKTGIDTVSTVELTKLREPKTFRIDRGGWFAFASPVKANSHLFVNRTDPVYLQVTNPKFGGIWVSIYADLRGRQVKKGDTHIYEFASLGFPLDSEIKTADDFVYMINYLNRPDGMQVVRGKKVDPAPGHGLVEIAPVNYAVELIIPRPKRDTNLTLPVRISGMNSRWSAGLFLREGYVKGFYGKGKDRYTHPGIDLLGYTYIPVYVDRADRTHFVAGHPVVADSPEGKELFIQVTALTGRTGDPPAKYTWAIEVNNPTDRTISTTLRKAMDLPGLEDLTTKKLDIKPGEHLSFRFHER